MNRLFKIGLFIGLLLPLAACSPNSNTASTSTSTTEPSSTVAGAKIRVVNLFEPPTGPVSLDLRPVNGTGNGTQLPFRTVAPTETSAYFEPPFANNEEPAFSVYPAGQSDEISQLAQIQQTFEPGDQVTILITANPTEDPAIAPTANVQTWFEQSADVSQSLYGLPAPKAGKALVLANASALNTSSGLNIGIPGQGCLASSISTYQGVLPSGTTSIPYEIEPGSISLAAYDFTDTSCATPLATPTALTLTAGQRAYAFAHLYEGKPTLLAIPIP